MFWGVNLNGHREEVSHKTRARDGTIYPMTIAGSVPTIRDLDAPASGSDAVVGCPMPLGFPLHGNREHVYHKDAPGKARST